MAKHKDYCPGYYGTPEEHAREVMNMTHQARREFFENCYLLAEEQRQQEERLKRPEYVEGLKQVESGLKELVFGEIECWEVCKPHTEVEKRK